MKTRKILLSSLLLCSAISAHAERRAYFSAIATSSPSEGTIQGLNTVAECTIVITNLGSTQQRITGIRFLGFDPSLGSVGQTLLNQSASSVYRFSATGSGGNSCVNQTLNQGDMCVARYRMDTLAMGEQHGICSGYISVDSPTASTAGAIIASGSIHMYEEAKVMGGVLSGAYYASGTRVDKNSANLAAAEGAFIHSSHDTFNMNIYCAQACDVRDGAEAGGIANVRRTFCENQCGYHRSHAHASEYMQPGGLSGEDAHMIAGWTESAYNGGSATGDTFLGFRQAGQNGATNSYSLTCEMYNDIPWRIDNGAPYDATTNSSWIISDTAGGAYGAAPAGTTTSGQLGCYGSSEFRTIEHVIRNGNANYAGGIVFEFEMGAFNAICSGNTSYAAEGGSEFTHFDAAPQGMLSGDLNPSYPHERLFCSHRHGQSDLFMKVGVTSPIVINGGMPF